MGVPLLPALLALSLAAEPAPVARPVHPAVLTVAVSGAGLITAGLVVELTGRALVTPGTPLEQWSDDARFRVVGGVALAGAGLCLFSLAALVTQHRLPTVSFLPLAGGGLFAVTVPLP